MNRFKHWLAVLFWCRLAQFHDWTCAAEEKIPPTEAQLFSGVPGFLDYARTYCRRCGRESRVSLKHRLAHPLLDQAEKKS